MYILKETFLELTHKNTDLNLSEDHGAKNFALLAHALTVRACSTAVHCAGPFLSCQPSQRHAATNVRSKVLGTDRRFYEYIATFVM